MNGKTSISALQELMAARRHPLPVYKEETDDTSFKCTVYVEGITAVGYGRTKKSAKHESAKNALDKLQSPYHQNIQIEEVCSVEKPLRNYVGELNEYSSKNGLRHPVYEFVTAWLTGQHVFKCSFVGQEVQGMGMNKKDAKQNAAKKMLELVDYGDSNIVDISRYKLVQTRTVVEVQNADTDAVIEMFNKLSIQKDVLHAERSFSIESAPEVNIDCYEDIKKIEKQLKDHNIEFNINDFQTNPYIVCLVIKGTNFTFLATGTNREDALKKVYLNVLTVKKSGCSLNCDLTSFI